MRLVNTTSLESQSGPNKQQYGHTSTVQTPDSQLIINIMIFKKLFKFALLYHDIPLPDDFTKLYPLLTNSKYSRIEVLEQMAKTKRDEHNLSQDRKNKIVSQLLKYKNGSGRRDKVATFAWIIVKLNLQRQLKQLIQDFVNRVDQDEWYVNFEESVRAMQAFHWIQDQQLRDRIYQKIERNVNLTIWEVNMNIYYRLTNSLILAKRFDAPLWIKLEYHIMRNLDMEYDPSIMLGLFLNFAKAGKGTQDFYNLIQLAICRGHLFLTPYLIQGRIQHSLSSSLIAPMIHTFGLVKLTLKVTLETEFKEYLQKILLHKNFEVQQLSHVTTILQYLQQYEYHAEVLAEFDESLYLKLSQIQGYIRLPDVIEFYEKMKYIGKEVPTKVTKLINDLSLYSILKGPKNVLLALQTYSYLSRNNLIVLEEFENLVDKWLQQNSKYFSGQDFKNLIYYMQQMNKPLQLAEGVNIGISIKQQPKELLK